jgi:amidase
VLAWDSYSVEGPMARSIADVALMLSVMAGPDDRAPISYPVDTDEFRAAVRALSVKGWRIAWTSDLGNLATVDDQVLAAFEGAVRAFRSAGARMEAACPDMTEVPEIVRLSRGLLMVARHADKLPEHRAVLQPGLVENTEQGLAMNTRDIARGELLRTTLWGRVCEFLADRDLWITPTMAVPAFPVEDPYVMEVNGQRVGTLMQRSFLTYAFSVLGLPAISVPCGFTDTGLPVGLQIVGKRRGEAAVLRAAAAFEAARPWADHVPPVVR